MISIIIPTYKRDDLLENCLVSIRDNSFYDNEIIILNPFCEIHLQNLAKKYNAKLYNDNSRINNKRVKGLWEIINYGIEKSGFKYICWLNDDCEVLKDWDKFAVSYFIDSTGVVVLKSKGIGGSDEFRTLKGAFNIDCANYGVLNKEIGLKFDNNLKWFWGDADISMQSKILYKKNIIPTKENCVIHKHIDDDNRKNNEANPINIQDENYFLSKWEDYFEISFFNLYFKNKFIKRIIYLFEKTFYYLKNLKQ